MAASTPSRLPAPCRLLVRFCARLVPRSVRAEWVAEWSGELHYLRQVAAPRTRADLILLRRSLGCLPDAVWIRTHDWSPDMLLQDVKFALRSHLKRPGFAAVVIAMLAIGIGANTALFSVVDGLLLRPLPYADADRLVRLYGFNEGGGTRYTNMNPNDLLDVRERSQTIADLSYYIGDSVTFIGGDEPARLVMGVVHHSFFDVLGAVPALGRWFRPEENVEGNDGVVVLSGASWRGRFGADPDIVGKTILLSGGEATVVGVAAAGFADPFENADLWAPWGRDPENRGGHFARAVARLRPSVGLEAAREEIAGIYAGIAAEHDKPGRGIEPYPLQDSLVGEARPLLVLLFGSVGFLLLIACANVAGLLLTRATGRQHEVAVRMSLGAGRNRLVRQLVTESVLLALAAGAAGMLLAYWLVQGIGSLAADKGLPAVFDVGIDVRVLAFCLAVSVGTGVLFGLAPAWQATRAELVESLRDGGRRGAAGRGRPGLRGGLVVVEVALSMVLLVGAGLMLRSLGRLLEVDPGFVPEGVLSFRLTLPQEDYPVTAEVPVFYEQLLERIGRLPGVEAAGITNRLPFSGGYSCDGFVLEGWPQPEPGRWECAEERVVGGDYFGAMGIELDSGRWLAGTDNEDAAPVVLVSRTMARTFMPGEERLGRGFKWGQHDERPFRRVVGVVKDVKHLDLTSEPMTEVYMPHRQYPFYRTMYVAVRAADPTALVPSIRGVLGELDPRLPIYAIAAMQERIDASVADRRIGAQVLGAFATLALLLASAGLYGVLAFSVSQRTREIGVRMALGAHGSDVIRMVMRQALVLVLIGVALGLAGAWALSGVLAGVLYSIRPDDPSTFASAAAVLALVACAAAWLPAHRATRIDPVRALKRE